MPAGRPGRRGLIMPGGSGLAWSGQARAGWAGPAGLGQPTLRPSSGVARGSVGQTCWPGPIRLGQLAGRRLASQWASGPFTWGIFEPSRSNLSSTGIWMESMLKRRVCDGPRMCPAEAGPKMCSAEAPDGRKKGNSAIMKSFCPYTDSDANKPQSERYTTRALQ